jgi:hypothetical protein
VTSVDQIANAVLYEGYILYPYRPTSLKNKQRWNFGLLYPRNYRGTIDGTSAGTMCTQCLIQGDAATSIQIRVRFLQVVARQIIEAAVEGGTRSANALLIDCELHQSWQEAIEREVALTYTLAELKEQRHQAFQFEAGSNSEPLTDPGGVVVGFVNRSHAAINGGVSLNADRVLEGVYRLTVQIENETITDQPDCREHDRIALETLVSTHTILETTDGEFVSSLDPPTALQDAVEACRNLNTWPVLAGDENGRATAMLSSPIILYDYPQVAEQSPGELFDGTEIDEILTLRIMTMTDSEKQEMRHADVRARSILERTESLTPEHFAQLHGVLRPASERRPA